MRSAINPKQESESAPLLPGRSAVWAITLLVLLGVQTPPAMTGEKLDRARELYQAKKYAEAEPALQEAVQEEPDNPEAHLLLGLTRVELQNYEPAIGDFKKVLDLSGPADRAQVGLARAYLGQQDWDKAEEALNEAQRANVDNAESYYYRGLLRAARKDYTAAAREFERCAELDSRHAYTHYHAGLAYNQLRKPDKMVKHFETFLALAPDAPEAPKVRALLRTIR